MMALPRRCRRCLASTRSYVSDEIMWRRRPNTSEGRPCLDSPATFRPSCADAGSSAAQRRRGTLLEVYFSYRGVLKRLRRGALGAEMDRIAECFFSLDYKRTSAKLQIAQFTCCCSTLWFRADRRSLSSIAIYARSPRTLRGSVRASTRAAAGARTAHYFGTQCRR